MTIELRANHNFILLMVYSAVELKKVHYSKVYSTLCLSLGHCYIIVHDREKETICITGLFPFGGCDTVTRFDPVMSQHFLH